MINASYWTPEMDEQLKQLYPVKTNREILAITGWQEDQLIYRAKHFNLKKLKETKTRSSGKIGFSPDQEAFIRDNYLRLTNKQLADHFGYKLTIVRNKLYEMGLQRNQVENWSPEQTAFLKENYRTTGDVEIAEQLQRLMPRAQAWTKKHINKKRQLMGWHRTPEEIAAIVAKHLAPGGRQYTILQNSSSIHLQDGYIASLIAWRDKDLQQEILKYPDLIAIKRSEILLTRAIKEVQHA